MADKLPVVYVLNGSLEHLSRLNQHASTSISVSMRPHAGALVAYEPAVPRCKTCKWFIPCCSDEPEVTMVCDGVDYRGDLPQDGSGYCSDHPDANRTTQDE